MPIIRVFGTVMMAISTLSASPTNMFTRMMESKMIYVHQIKYICEECIKLGMKRECKHRRYAKPDWLEGSDDFQQSLFPDDEDLRRENTGVMDNNDRHCFTPSSIAAMASRARVSAFDLTAPPRYVFTSVDPQGGCSNPDRVTSAFAVVSGCSYRDGYCILGMEEIAVRQTSDYADILARHIAQIRLTRGLEDTTLVLDVESNGHSVEANNIQRIAMVFPRVAPLNDSDVTFGTDTTNANKHVMMELMRSALEAGNLYIYDGLITSHPKPADMILEFVRQLMEYSRYTKPSTAVNRPSVNYYHGKGPNKRDKDDLCVTAQRSLFSRFRYTHDDKFRDLRTQYN